MKLATLNDQTRDGKLLLVNRDLTRMIPADSVAPTLQALLDNWEELYPAMQKLEQKFLFGQLQDMPYEPQKLLSPLPRAYQWADGSAYVNHVELVRKARGAEMPQDFWTDPLVYQGGSDDFLAPCADILCPDAAFGIDFESEVAVITSDVPMGTVPDKALAHIRLLMLVNDVSLRNLIPAELAKGFGFYQSKPATAFSPLALTPDELGSAFKDGKVHLELTTVLNDKIFGQPNAGVDMTFSFHQLIHHLSKTRNLRAGSIIGSGTVSNYDRKKGSSCIAEKRCLETLEHGKAITPFLQQGDRVQIYMLNTSGQDLFGKIDQKIRIGSA